jgi:chaperonin GroEL
MRASLSQKRYASKEIRFGIDARERMLQGVQKLGKAVATTLGPKGRNVIIQQPFGAPKITKDGVTVAKAIEFKDAYENLGAQLIRQVATSTNDVAGDGTTTSTVLANAIFSEGYKQVVQGRSPVEMQRGVQRAAAIVVASLEELKREISSGDEIEQVATISANGDKEIGSLIASALAKVGKDGIVTTQDGKTLTTELEVVEGMSFDRGYISPYFVTNTREQKVEFEDALIVVLKQKLSDAHTAVTLLQEMVSKVGNKPIVLISEDVDGEALAVLILNKLQGRIKLAAVKAPGFGDNRANILEDIAVVTGGKVIDEETGGKIEKEMNIKAFVGSADKVTITKDNTIILGGRGAEGDINARTEFIREQVKSSTSDYDKEKLQERLAKIAGGIAVIRVGGGSEVEVGEKKDRVTDALNATKCAIQGGIVAGGGVALLYSTRKIAEELKKTDINEDQKTGMRIVMEACKLPVKQISENAGVDGSVVIHEITSKNDPTYGFDAYKMKYVDMFKAGIIDPTKVVKTALNDASSVAGLLMTTEAAIVDLPEKETKTS